MMDIIKHKGERIMVLESVITFDKEEKKMLTQSNRITDCKIENLTVTDIFVGDEDELERDVIAILEKQKDVVIIKRETKDFIRYTTLMKV